MCPLRQAACSAVSRKWPCSSMRKNAETRSLFTSTEGQKRPSWTRNCTTSGGASPQAAIRAEDFPFYDSVRPEYAPFPSIAGGSLTGESTSSAGLAQRSLIVSRLFSLSQAATKGVLWRGSGQPRDEVCEVTFSLQCGRLC